ncbi:MAG: AAA family ATPase [Cyanobacteriota bacterium]|nr:AAA family ATPase [Cyanobacteriota bacterium]
MFDIREHIEFDRNGRAYCPSCEIKKGRRPRQRSLAIVPGSDGAYLCHAGCSVEEIREAVGQPKPKAVDSVLRKPSLASPSEAKDPPAYTEIQVMKYVGILVNGKTPDAVAAREWLGKRGFTTDMMLHYKLSLFGSHLQIPIPTDDAGSSYHLKSRIAPWTGNTAWAQKGIPAMVFFTYKPEGATQTWLCEGEWDAMLLGWKVREVGIQDIAVATFTCGCNAIPMQLELERLVGEVMIFYDRDQPGQNGSEKLAKKLGSRARIAQVPAPDIFPKGWDISDALNSGFSLEDLQKAANQAMPFIADKSPAQEVYGDLLSRLERAYQLESASERIYHLELISREVRIPTPRLTLMWMNHVAEKDTKDPLEVHQFVEKSPERRPFLIPGFLPTGTIVVLVADGGTGKTLLANHLCLSIAKGGSWNGKPVKQGRVLIIQSDEPELECAARLRDANFPDLDPGWVYVKTNWQFSQLPLLKKWLQQYQPALVMIDSLTATNRHSEAEERDTAYGLVLYELRDLANQYGTTFLVLHHTNKLGIERGTTAIRDNVGEVWLLKHGDKTDPSNLERKLVIDKSRTGCNDTHTLELNDEDFSWILKPKDPNQEGKTPLEDRLLDFMERSPDIPREIEEIAHEFNVSWSSARRALKKLWRLGYVNEETLAVDNHNGRGGKTTKKVFTYPRLLNSDQDPCLEPSVVTIQLDLNSEERPGSLPEDTSGHYSSAAPVYNPARPF